MVRRRTTTVLGVGVVVLCLAVWLWDTEEEGGRRLSTPELGNEGSRTSTGTLTVRGFGGCGGVVKIDGTVIPCDSSGKFSVLNSAESRGKAELDGYETKVFGLGGDPILVEFVPASSVSIAATLVAEVGVVEGIRVHGTSINGFVVDREMSVRQKALEDGSVEARSSLHELPPGSYTATVETTFSSSVSSFAIEQNGDSISVDVLVDRDDEQFNLNGSIWADGALYRSGRFWYSINVGGHAISHGYWVTDAEGEIEFELVLPAKTTVVQLIVQVPGYHDFRASMTLDELRVFFDIELRRLVESTGILCTDLASGTTLVDLPLWVKSQDEPLRIPTTARSNADGEVVADRPSSDSTINLPAWRWVTEAWDGVVGRGRLHWNSVPAVVMEQEAKFDLGPNALIVSWGREGLDRISLYVRYAPSTLRSSSTWANVEVGNESAVISHVPKKGWFEFVAIAMAQADGGLAIGRKQVRIAGGCQRTVIALEEKQSELRVLGANEIGVVAAREAVSFRSKDPIGLDALLSSILVGSDARGKTVSVYPALFPYWVVSPKGAAIVDRRATKGAVELSLDRSVTFVGDGIDHAIMFGPDGTWHYTGVSDWFCFPVRDGETFRQLVVKRHGKYISTKPSRGMVKF